MATSSSSISWQVLVLVANHVDPKTLATASCVSKSWYAAATSDHLWSHLTTSTFPSLAHLRSAAALPYHHLYSLAFTAAKRRRQPPPKPRLTLNDLLFIITLHNSTSPSSPPPLTLIKPGSALPLDPKSLFRFDLDGRVGCDVGDEMRVTWNVALRGSRFEGVFTMMDCMGKGRFVSGTDGWFSAELPAAGCCGGGGGTSGLVADLRLTMKEEEEGGKKKKKKVVERVSVGVLSIVSWRYVGVDDGLRYLQHFLQPSHV